MGDRANIQIQEVATLLATALNRGQDRWDDETRIIFSEMIQESETGYGISTYRGDYNYDDLVVDMANKTVTDRDGVTYSFSEFVRKYNKREGK